MISNSPYPGHVCCGSCFTNWPSLLLSIFILTSPKSLWDSHRTNQETTLWELYMVDILAPSCKYREQRHPNSHSRYYTNISTACWNLSGVLLSFFPRHSLSIIIIWQVSATQYPSLYKLSIIAKSQARSVAALWRVLSAPWVLSSAPSTFVTL